jgi:MFS family permease
VVPGNVPVVLRTWWARTVEGLPKPFFVLLVGTFFVQPFLALYLAGPRDLDASTVGTVVACFGFGSFVSQPVGGYLTDRIGRRTTLVGSMLGTAAAFMLFAAARGLVLIAVAATVAGLMIDAYRPAVSALVADLVTPERRPRAFALLYWAINLGVSVAGVAGGFLASRSYWLLFVLDAVTCAAFGVLIARLVPETRVEVGRVGGHGYGTVIRDGVLLGLVASTVLGSIVYLQHLVTLPLAMRADGYGPSGFGLVYAVNPLTVIAVQPLVLWVVDRLPAIPLLAGSSVVLGFGYWLITFADTLPMFAATVVVWTLGEIGFNAVGPALVADIAPPDQRGRYSAAVGVAFGASAFAAPIVGTQVFQAFGETVLWSGCFVVATMSAMIVLALAPAIHARRAALKTTSPGTAPVPVEP